MARFLCIGSCSFLLVVVIVCAASRTCGQRHFYGQLQLLAVECQVGQAAEAVVQAHKERPVRAERRLYPIATLFAALSGCRKSLSERERWQVAGVIHQESQRYGYDPLFVVALAQIESTCRPAARSRHGAVGLIQVRPSIARAVAEQAGLRWRGAHMLTKPLFNLHVGLRYLLQLEKQFGDPTLAVAAYNLGPKRVQRMQRHHARGTTYVQSVLSRYEALLAQYTPSGCPRDS